jgi:chromosomal replication initiation ATPase DnaA
MTPRQKNHDAMTEIATRHGVTLNDIINDRRDRITLAARWECIFHFRTKGLSLPAIGRIMKRDHTTILYALNRMNFNDN